MEIEKIVSTVQERLGKTDVSAQTIQKAVEFRNSVAPLADGVEPDDAYFAGLVDLAKDFQGNINHLLATKVGEFKKNFKLDQDTIKNMTAAQLAELKALVGINDQDGFNGNHEEVDALKAEITKLKERIDGSDSTRKQAELLQKVKSAMKEQKAEDEYVLEKSLEGVTLDVNKSVEELTKEMLVKYDSEYLRCRGTGTPPRQGGTGGENAKTLLDEMWEKRHPKKQ